MSRPKYERGAQVVPYARGVVALKAPAEVVRWEELASTKRFERHILPQATKKKKQQQRDDLPIFFFILLRIFPLVCLVLAGANLIYVGTH